jgi:RNA polymerase sigma-70 factor (ECF subfamily)
VTIRRQSDDSALARRQHIERLFGTVYAPIQRYVRRRLPDASVVDDVVAETLVVLWRRLDDEAP